MRWGQSRWVEDGVYGCIVSANGGSSDGLYIHNKHCTYSTHGAEIAFRGTGKWRWDGITTQGHSLLIAEDITSKQSKHESSNIPEIHMHYAKYKVCIYI